MTGARGAIARGARAALNPEGVRSAGEARRAPSSSCTAAAKCRRQKERGGAADWAESGK